MGANNFAATQVAKSCTIPELNSCCQNKSLPCQEYAATPSSLPTSSEVVCVRIPSQPISPSQREEHVRLKPSSPWRRSSSNNHSSVLSNISALHQRKLSSSEQGRERT
eukprot:scaffold86143_cov16-Tisochrysis_lutea.AAC.1